MNRKSGLTSLLAIGKGHSLRRHSDDFKLN